MLRTESGESHSLSIRADRGILLVVGDKSGVSQGRFYEQFIAKADKRYTAHLARLKKASAKKG